MSFDCYVAICNPFHYSTVLTDTRVAHMGISIIIRSFCIVVPLPFLLKRLPFCKDNILTHSYCLHPDLILLPCGDTAINSMYGLFIVIAAFGVDSVLILLSYVLILHSVLAIASREERLKSLNTCVSHICAVLIFYVPMVSVSMVHQFGKHAPEYVHKLTSLVSLFVPPMLNPIIYSIKTKEICRRLHEILISKHWSERHLVKTQVPQEFVVIADIWVYRLVSWTVSSPSVHGPLVGDLLLTVGYSLAIIHNLKHQATL